LRVDIKGVGRCVIGEIDAAGVANVLVGVIAGIAARIAATIPLDCNLKLAAPIGRNRTGERKGVQFSFADAGPEQTTFGRVGWMASEPDRAGPGISGAARPGSVLVVDIDRHKWNRHAALQLMRQPR
jgi:hypothetical protein